MMCTNKRYNTCTYMYLTVMLTNTEGNLTVLSGLTRLAGGATGIEVPVVLDSRVTEERGVDVDTVMVATTPEFFISVPSIAPFPRSPGSEHDLSPAPSCCCCWVCGFPADPGPLVTFWKSWSKGLDSNSWKRPVSSQCLRKRVGVGVWSKRGAMGEHSALTVHWTVTLAPMSSVWC